MITLLNGHSLAARDRFMPERMGLQLSERQSTATLTLGPDAPVLGVDDWLKAEDGPGAGIVWRVKTIDEQFDKKTRTVTVEHVIQALRDRLMFGEVKTKDISGSSSATAKQAVQYILNRQGDWVLGGIEFDVSNPYNFNGDDLFSALETVTGSLDSAIWEYDMAAYPFKLYIRKMSDTVMSEMRSDRNIKTLKKTIDRSRMYTRHYPIGKNNLHIDGDYVSKNENLYGIICKTETDQGKDTKEKLKAWAEERLKKHCEPYVTVSISGLELAEATGEALDRFTIGSMCRVPLPEFSTTITERVNKLSYSDVINMPMEVTVTLANEVQDIATILNEQNASGGAGGRAGAKNDEEDHAWMVDTTDHIGLVAEAVAGEGADKDWSRVASVMVDGEGIHQRVTKTEKDVLTAFSEIDVNENLIRLETQKRTEGDNYLSGKISVEAGKISQIVSAVGANGEVTAASIVLAINESGESSAHIDANKVYIGNQKSMTVIAGKCSLADVTADYIGGQIAQIANLSVQTITSERGGISVHSVGTTSYTQGGISCYVPHAIWNLQIVQEGSLLKLQRKRFSEDDWVTVATFDRAAPTTLTGAWSGRTYTVTASPQGNTESVTVYVRPVSSQGAAYTDIYTATNDGSWTNHGEATRLTMVATGMRVDLKDANNAVYAQLTVPNPTVTTSGSWSGKTYTVQAKIGSTVVSTETENVDVHAVGSQGDYADMYVATPGSSWTNHGTAKRLTANVSNGQAQIRDGSTVLAQKAVTASVSFDCTDGGNPSSDYNDKPVTATAKNGTATIGTGNQIIHMNQGSWNNGKKAVNVRLGDNDGKLVTRIWVNMPSTATWRFQRNGNQLLIYCKAGGKEYNTTYNL
jgi:phage minor structural protein